MSRLNEGRSSEEPHEEPSGETMSSSSCSTATSDSRSGSSHSGSSSGSTNSSGSDSEGSDQDNLHRHRHCHTSKVHSCKPDSIETESSTEDKHGLQSATGHTCDIRTINCPLTTICSTATTTTSQTKSSPQSQAPPHFRSTQLQTTEVSKLKQVGSNPDSQKSTLNNSTTHADELSIRQTRQFQVKQNLTAKVTSLGSSYSNLSSTTSTNEPSTGSSTITQSTSFARRILKPAPAPSTTPLPTQSPSLTALDTNNNKNHDNNISSTSRDGLSSKRTNFSKSASGSRLVNRSRPIVCDCLSQDCGEKKHSNRRQFIEQYYNSRTQLPSANTSISSFNISTPLNRLNECDAITKRLLSSPIRASNVVESPTRRVQTSDVDKTRRASLGTTTMTDQVFLFASNPFKSLESSYKRNNQDKHRTDNQRRCDVESAPAGGGNDVKFKQQQGRSLSVCDEETLNPRIRNNSSNHSSNLNRAISLACESGSASSSRRLLTLIPLFGCDIKSLEQFTSLGLILPPVIDSAVDHILANGINSVGIFRKSGVKSRILTLRQKVEANQFVMVNELNQNNEFSIYDIADLVKMWFRELKPVPLMTKELIRIISTFLNSTMASTSVPQSTSILKRGNSSQQPQETLRATAATDRYVDPVLKSRIDSITTPTHRALLLRALNFLAQISSRCEVNQMTSQNLAICLTPSLCETESDQNSILIDQKALEYCIDNHRLLFGRPSARS